MAHQIITTVTLVVCVLSLASCLDVSDNDNAINQLQPVSDIPQPTTPIVTDRVQIAAMDLVLLDHNGACQLQYKQQNRYLKPMAPCYFVRQNNTIQQYKNADTNLIAVVGTPIKRDKCGQEVQGIFLKNNGLELSSRIAQGSIFCADKGLDSFNFSLF